MSIETPIILAVDIGTTTVTASLFDAKAQPVEGFSCTVPNSQDIRGDGTNEIPPERIYKAVESAIDGALDLAGSLSREICAVALDSMAGTFVGLDRSGSPVTPIYTYADTRNAEAAELIKKVINPDAIHDATGAAIHTSYLPARILWLKRHYPETARSVYRWSDIATMLYNRWFGVTSTPCSFSMAAWSGLLNRREMKWDDVLLELLDLSRESLPTLSEYSVPLQGLTRPFSHRWPMLAAKPFFLGVGDGFAANVSAGCVSPSSAALTVGTTAAMRVIVPDAAPIAPKGLWVYRMGKLGSLLGGAFSEGGNIVSWCAQVLRLPPLDVLESELYSMEPDAHGLTFLPFLAGERAVGWSPQASGIVHGLRLSTTPLELLQAAMEAVACRFVLVKELMPSFREGNQRVVACGGALGSSRWWIQTMANALGLPVQFSEEAKETVRGTAILGLNALGIWKSLDEILPKITESFEPDLAITERYQGAIERQKKLYSQVISPPKPRRPCRQTCLRQWVLVGGVVTWFAIP